MAPVVASSHISKSTAKKLQPKASGRRPGAPGSSQTSARASVDRQSLASTPQPAVTQRETVPSPKPAAQTLRPEPASPSNPSATRAVPADGSTQISIPAQKRVHIADPQSQRENHDIHVRQRSPRETSRPSQQPLVSADVANTGPPSASLRQPPETTSLEQSSNARIIHLPSSTPRTTRTTTRTREVITPSSDLPPSKRRRISTPRQRSSTEESSAVETQSVEIAQSIETVNDGGASTVAQSSSSLPKPSQVKAQKKSAKAKDKSRAEDQAAQVVANASGATPKQTRTRKKPTKPRNNQSAEDRATQIIQDAVEGGSQQTQDASHGGRRRASTPEGAEQAEITPSTVKLGDLVKDRRTGKKSLRETELQNLDWTAIVRKQREKEQETANRETNPPESAEERLERLARENEQHQDSNVPTTTLVNGEIEIDESSRFIDRHANAEAAREAEPLEIIEETDLTRRVNSHTWSKKDHTERWNEQSTERLYEGLRMFGTDFGMISKLFPGRTRGQIKRKFVKEEKLDKEKIKQTLLGKRVPVDMEEFSKITDTVYMNPEDLEKDLEEDRRKLEEEQAVEKEAMDEILRQRAAETAAEAAAVGNDSSAKENEGQGHGTGTKAKKSRKKGNKASTKKTEHAKQTSGEGQIEVLGNVGDFAHQDEASTIA